MRLFEGEFRSIFGGGGGRWWCVPARILVQAPSIITGVVKCIRRAIMITTVDVMAFLLSEWNGSDPTGRTYRENLHRRILLKFAAVIHSCLKADRRSRHFAKTPAYP